MPEMARLSLILLGVCFVSAAALSQTYESTRERILANRARVEAEARLAVLPGAVRIEKEPEEAATPDGGSVTIFRGVDEHDQLVGWALRTATPGFSGEISVMVGAVRDERGELVVAGTRVLRHTETPGLGAELNTVSFEDRQAYGERAIPVFQQQFIGRRRSDVVLRTETAASNALDVLTAATVSARAFADCVREGLDIITSHVEGGAGR